MKRDCNFIREKCASNPDAIVELIEEYEETIAIEKFQPQNIELHQQRMDISYLSLFKNTNPFNLSELIKYENIPSEGLFKWKILYPIFNKRIYKYFSIKCFVSLQSKG